MKKVGSAGKTPTAVNIVRNRSFSADDMLKEIRPATKEEAEKFVRLIYAERRRDLAHDQPA